MDATPGLDSLDQADLTAPVRQATGRPTLEVVDWECSSIHIPFNWATGGVYRVMGTGRDGDELVRWSMILKVAQYPVRSHIGTVDPTDYNYWKREAILYQSGLLDNLQGLQAARSFGVVERSDTSAWLWLEDVHDPMGSRWPLERYRVAAHHLGQFNGAYLHKWAMPDLPCFTRDFLRSFMTAWAPWMARLPDVRDHPYVTRSCPATLLKRILGLWSEKEHMLTALDRLPRTFCHLDAFPRNLLVRTGPGGVEETVAVDWAFTGIAPIGADLAPMVAASVWFFDAAPDQMAEIDSLVFDGYVEGLRAAGWHGDTRVIRFGYVASAALRYGLFALLSTRQRKRGMEIMQRAADRWSTRP